MNQNVYIKLILFKDFKELKTIIEVKTSESLESILNIAENWKEEDIKRNSIRLSIETVDE
jgi:uncharacterized protein YqgV (UPF0045/DUF77 family)